MSQIHVLLSALMLGLASHASADQLLTSPPQRVPLLELFTSEGCSSCPPAEHWLSSLRHSPDLWHKFVPVAFHVDYWDSLGWPDRFASPANSQRQYRYQAEQRISQVYTPGFVVDGSEWRGWFRSALQLPASQDNAGQLQIRLHAGLLDADFQPNQATSGPLLLNLAWLGMDRETQVQRGENSGRTLRHDFVVLQQQRLQADHGHWHSQIPQQLEDGSAPQALAAWVSNTRSAAPLQAVGGWLP